MGAEQQVITYKNDVKYEGQTQKVNKMIPQGLGRIVFSENRIFQGQFVNGLSTKGIYRVGDTFKYEGETKLGKISGQAKLYVKMEMGDKLIYEGKFEEGIFIEGKVINEGYYQYYGYYKDFQFLSGKGYFHNLVNSKKYEGNFVKSKLQGEGKISSQNGQNYSGSFLGSFPHGKVTYKSQKIFVDGQFKHGVLEGNQQIKFANGDSYSGNCSDGNLHGQGTYKYVDGTVYKGTFYKNRTWGLCMIEYPKVSQVQKYEGQIQDNLYNGHGIIYYKNGVIYSGYFYMGLKNGPGFLIYGSNKFKCLFTMDKILGNFKNISIK